MITVTKNVYLENRGRRINANPTPPAATAVGRIPRIAKLMALAIRFDKLIRDGVVKSQTELAELARVTQPRMTQILNLNNLAPDIQEELLYTQNIFQGRDVLHERLLRMIVNNLSWNEQRRDWQQTQRRLLAESGFDGADVSGQTLSPNTTAGA